MGKEVGRVYTEVHAPPQHQRNPGQTQVEVLTAEYNSETIVKSDLRLPKPSQKAARFDGPQLQCTVYC